MNRTRTFEVGGLLSSMSARSVEKQLSRSTTYPAWSFFVAAARALCNGVLDMANLVVLSVSKGYYRRRHGRTTSCLDRCYAHLSHRAARCRPAPAEAFAFQTWSLSGVSKWRHSSPSPFSPGSAAVLLGLAGCA